MRKISNIIPDFALIPESSRGLFCEMKSSDTPALISINVKQCYRVISDIYIYLSPAVAKYIPESSRKRFFGGESLAGAVYVSV